MPRKSDSIPIDNEKLDRRVKLTKDQKEIIFNHYHIIGEISINQLARDYGVSKRTIQFILFPERLEASKQARQARGGSMQYYDKDKHREEIKAHREYKKELYQKNLIGKKGK